MVNISIDMICKDCIVLFSIKDLLGIFNNSKSDDMSILSRTEQIIIPKNKIERYRVVACYKDNLEKTIIEPKFIDSLPNYITINKLEKGLKGIQYTTTHFNLICGIEELKQKLNESKNVS